MPHLALSNLGLKIDDLVQRHLKLLAENQLLNQELERLRAEKALLSSKNELAIAKIKQVASQLREEIHERIA